MRLPCHVYGTPDRIKFVFSGCFLNFQPRPSYCCSSTDKKPLAVLCEAMETSLPSGKTRHWQSFKVSTTVAFERFNQSADSRCQLVFFTVGIKKETDKVDPLIKGHELDL